MRDMPAEKFEPDTDGADIVALAGFLQQQSAPPAPPGRRRPLLRVASGDVAKIKVDPRLAHKAISETVLASVCPDDPEFQSTGRDVVAGLVGIAPKTPVEAMLATQMISLHNAVADSCGWRVNPPGRSGACTLNTLTGCRGPSLRWSRLSSGSATRAARPWWSSTFAAIRSSAW